MNTPTRLPTFIFGRNPKRTLIRAAILAIFTFVTFKFALIPVRITGISMEPTYHDGRVNLINRLAYRWHTPQRADVVAIKTSGLHVLYLKRIIGLPGETIAIHQGTVLINDKPLPEPWITGRIAHKTRITR